MVLIGTSMLRKSAAFLAALLWFPLAHATVVLPGQSNVPIEEKSFDFGPVEQKTRTFAFGGLSGEIIDSVISVNGFLAFETQVLIKTAPVGFLVDKVLRTNYAGFTTDAQPEPDRGGIFFPETADRSDLPGSTVTFNFLPESQNHLQDLRIPVGGNGSSFFVILTNATSYKEVGELRLGSGNELFGPISVFSPVTAAIPEPGQWLLLLVGAGLLGAMSRRRS